MQQQRLYPVGKQVFSEIIRKNYLYIDKTEYVYRMTHSAASFVFLNRPRRFGKSLLASTLHCYFEGQKELFKGLALENLETEWIAYPVLHFDLSTAKYADKEQLEQELNYKLSLYEDLYGRNKEEVGLNQRLTGIIRRAYQQTGRQVVVLVDEYDAPLLDVMHEDENLPELRNVMRNFYSPLKACEVYLRFVFLTGITKFSQLSIFSELNNMQNISMLPEYAAVCGITEDEMRRQMAEDLVSLAFELQLPREEMLPKLKEYYDGYHFAWPSPDVYNPYGLMNAFATKRIDSFWFGSGTPTYLLEMLRKYSVGPEMIGDRQAKASVFDAPTQVLADITPLLYQSGYITIKDYNKKLDLYTLDIPNKEVRIGLMEGILPYYVSPAKTRETGNVIAYLYEAIDGGEVDRALAMLKTFLSTLPQCDNTNYEGHYQSLLYTIFSLLGFYVDVEVRTAKGRVDMVLRTDSALYLFELKLNKDAETAMRQIDLKKYPKRFALCGLPVVKVGVNFDGNTHSLKDWMIEKVSSTESVVFF